MLTEISLHFGYVFFDRLFLIARLLFKRLDCPDFSLRSVDIGRLLPQCALFSFKPADIVKQLKELERGDKVIFVIDSIGNSLAQAARKS